MAHDNYINQIQQEEHDHLEGKVAVKKTGNYGWNGSDWERLQSTGGKLQVDIDMAAEGIATETTLATRVKESSTPTVYTVTMTLANTEYSQALPANTRKVMLQTRGAYDSRIAFATGKVATPVEPYFTLKSYDTYYDDMINLASQTIYFACGTAGQVIEIVVWS